MLSTGHPIGVCPNAVRDRWLPGPGQRSDSTCSSSTPGACSYRHLVFFPRNATRATLPIKWQESPTNSANRLIFKPRGQVQARTPFCIYPPMVSEDDSSYNVTRRTPYVINRRFGRRQMQSTRRRKQKKIACNRLTRSCCGSSGNGRLRRERIFVRTKTTARPANGAAPNRALGQ